MATLSEFADALVAGDKQALRRIPKSDHHSHAAFACTLEDLESIAGEAIAPPPQRLHDVEVEAGWCQRYLAPVVQEPSRRRLLIDAAFKRAREDGVTLLSLIFNLTWVRYYRGKFAELVAVIDASHRQNAPDVRLRPSMSLIRHLDPTVQSELFDECLETGYFSSIDLFGDPASRPFRDFRSIYEKAGASGLKRLAHMSDSVGPDESREAVEELDLDAVQHGTAAAESVEAMRWLVDRGVALNICPSASVVHGVANSLSAHPIKILFEHGVKVTINTDVSLLTGKSLSEEYLGLYRAGTLEAEDLDAVRLTGLEE